MAAGQGGFQLLLTLALMFFGALGAGYLPYYINVKDAKLNTMTALGGGLLIGSALSVVIPEGFRSFYDFQQTETSQSLSGLALVLGFIAMVALDRVQASTSEKGVPGRQEHALALAQECDVETGGDAVGEQYKAVPKVKTDSDVELLENSTAAKKVFKNQLYDEHSSTGSVLHLAPCAHKSIVSKNPERAITGLLVHCAADGLAMGSAFLSENPSLGLLVGLAMVIHKAPMAFGLSAYLQSCHWSWPKAQKTLILFSAAAPASTMVTYTILSMIPIFTSGTATSMAILFSGGTFLQAATMHILPDALNHESMSMEVLGAFIVGCFFPTFLSYIGHHHH